jgi:hypothetical protein
VRLPNFRIPGANSFGVLGARPKIYDDVGPSPGQRQRNRRANAAASSGNQSQLPVQSLHKFDNPDKMIPIRIIPLGAVAARTEFVVQRSLVPSAAEGAQRKTHGK